MKIRVTLNGGPVNVHLQYGLRCNPFPAIPAAEYLGANEMLRQLDADPLRSTDDIRRILTGCDEVFITLCCARFIPGQRVSFFVEFPD